MKESISFKQNEVTYVRRKIAEKTGVWPFMWVQAFTRKSYAVQWGGRDNEELEYIGDSVLNYYVVKILTDRFGGRDIDHDFRYHLNYHKIDQLKKKLVSNENLAKKIDEWDLVKYLIVGKSDIQNHIDEQEKVKADLFEAILGSVAVQKKFDPEILENAVYKMLSMDDVFEDILSIEYRPIQYTIDNAITTLKELAEHGEIRMPEYDCHGPECLGYDKDGNPIWCCGCSVNKFGIGLCVFANSKKDAKKAAAYLIIIQHYGYPNEYGPSKRDSVWSYKNGQLIPGDELVCNKYLRENKGE